MRVLSIAGTAALVDWDRTADLASITVPALVMGATHDTMDPAHLEGMAQSFPRGRYHHSPEGSHLAIYDDQKSWFEGLLRFLRDVDSGAFQLRERHRPLPFRRGSFPIDPTRGGESCPPLPSTT